MVNDAHTFLEGVRPSRKSFNLLKTRHESFDAISKSENIILAVRQLLIYSVSCVQFYLFIYVFDFLENTDFNKFGF